MAADPSSDLHPAPARPAANAASVAPLTSLLYQSRAAEAVSEPALQQLVQAAQARNQAEAVTGLLVHDQGRFLQWLEGPARGVQRVWQSISHDTRHTQLEMVGEAPIAERLFGGSSLALAQRRSGGTSAGSGRLKLPSALIDGLYQKPETAPVVLAGLVPAAAARPRTPLLAVVSSVILPQLKARHARPSPVPVPVPLSAPVPVLIEAWAPELARLLVAADPAAAFALIDRHCTSAVNIAQLCAGLFEPTSRALGELWHADDCTEFDVTLGLNHLQQALRRFSLQVPTDQLPLLPASMPHAVLVVPSPQEPHGLGSAIASEMFWRAGWDVSCEFPTTDAALGQLVREHWFDVLDLSLSTAFTREHRLPAMAASIRAAHASSRNPALVVIVDGRAFHEQPQNIAAVGADGGSTSALGIVAAAQQGRG